MARLTRTEKYAQLREQVVNDRENSTSTSQLESFENRLNNIQQTLSNKVEEPAETVVEVKDEPVIDDSFIKQITEEINPVELVNEESFNTLLFGNDTQNNVVEVPVVEEIVEEPVIIENKVEDTVENVTETVVNKPVVVETVENTVDTAIEEPEVVETVETAPVVEESKYVWETFEDNFSSDLDKILGDLGGDIDFSDLFKDTETAVDVETPEQVNTEVTPVVEEIVENTVIEEPEVVETVETAQVEDKSFVDLMKEEIDTTVEEAVSALDAVIENPFEDEVNNVETEAVSVTDTPVEEVQEKVEVTDNKEVEDYMDYFKIEEEDNSSNSSYTDYFEETPVNLMDEAIAEIDSYNQSTGEKSIMEITDSLVEEVRHPVEAELDADEVSAEVKKEEPVQEVEDIEFSNTVSMEISKIMDETASVREETPAVVETPEVEKTELVHPVLVQTLEEVDDGVEIKNLKEIDIEPARDATISSTIPFIVSNNDDEDEEYDDEEGSNSILNIILVILIIILVAVLGLIVFYILKTKGII